MISTTSGTYSSSVPSRTQCDSAAAAAAFFFGGTAARLLAAPCSDRSCNSSSSMRLGSLSVDRGIRQGKLLRGEPSGENHARLTGVAMVAADARRARQQAAS